MDENNRTGTMIPVPARIQQSLALLSLLTSTFGVTFNVYTSKRLRCWASFKTWSPTLFVTSVEVAQSHGPGELCDAMVIAGVQHYLMLRGIYTPANTWLDMEGQEAARKDAYAMLDALLTGENPTDVLRRYETGEPTQDARATNETTDTILPSPIPLKTFRSPGKTSQEG